MVSSRPPDSEGGSGILDALKRKRDFKLVGLVGTDLPGFSFKYTSKYPDALALAGKVLLHTRKPVVGSMITFGKEPLVT